jgi:fructose-1,6-bisphosphatase/inositol monophosphatase family enzyme
VTPIDIDRVSALVRDTALSVVLPRFEHLAAAEIHQKAAGDLVTIADLEAEAALTPALAAILPGSLVVGEEATAKDPGILGRLDGDDPVWLIDPVDGTANFAAGMPLFAVMVALCRGGAVLASWIYDPVKDLMATAEEGGGAWANGTRLHVAEEERPDRMSGAVSIRFGNRHLVRRIAGRSNLVGSVFSFRCAGQEYMALATGRAHFALYHRLLPWDHAPGYLLHREAGGFSRRLDGSAYSPRIHDGGLLLTPDEASWMSLHAALIAKG